MADPTENKDLTDILKLISDIEKRLEPQMKSDLADKIYYTTTFKQLRHLVTKLTVATPLHVTEQTQPEVADVDAPTQTTFDLNAARAKAVDISADILAADQLFRQARELLSPLIRSADKRIINLQIPARPKEWLHNSFDNRKGRALFVLSTNSDAYIATISEQQLASISSARYWKSLQSVNPQ